MPTRLKNRSLAGSPYDPMDGMADSMAREALTSHASFKRSQKRIAHHLKKTASQLMRGFGPKSMPKLTVARKRPKHQNGATGRGSSRGY